MKTEKGCVYFFRHIGLSPIKIGYSSKPSPLKRFTQFKTYAPYGAEIVGFIQTDQAKEIETFLHQKYISSRLDGEWFEITEDQVKSEIKLYSSKEDIKKRNDFQIAWAKSLVEVDNVPLSKLKIEITNELFECIDSIELDTWITSNDFYHNYLLSIEKHSGRTKTFVTQAIKKYCRLFNLSYNCTSANNMKTFIIKKK